MPEILTESFCERCGTRYTFESAQPKTARLKGFKVVSRGLKNFVMSDDTSLDEAMAAARSETDREVTSQQLDAFHKTFNFCMTCRQYTCSNCWNEVEGRCLTCAPNLGHEIMPSPFPDLAADGGLAALGAEAANGTDHANGHAANGNGHDSVAGMALAWPTSDLMREQDLPAEGAEATAAAEPLDETELGLEPIDAVARLSFLSGWPGPEEVPPVDESAAAAEAAAAEAEPVVETEAPAPVVEPIAAVAAEAVEAEPPAAPAAPVTPTEVAATADAPEITEEDLDGRAAAAAAQTSILLQRFRPGESLDDEIAAYERAQAERDTTQDVVETAAVAAVLGSAASDTPPDDAAAAADVEAETEPDAAPEIAEIAASASEPVVTDTPEPVAASAAEPVAPADVVEQPVWRIVAPDNDVAVPGQPAGPADAPPAGAPGDPQWPTRPEWPSQQGAGLPFLNRPAAASGGIEALWAESARQVSTAPEPAGRAVGGVQPCVSCGLSLSATARFCRRCGTSQV